MEVINDIKTYFDKPIVQIEVKKEMKGISFYNVTAYDVKFSLINTINKAIDRMNEVVEEQVNHLVFPKKFNVSFWYNEEGDRCGLTLNINKTKYGFKLYKEKWWPCSYMRENGYDKISFIDEENLFITNVLTNHCSLYKKLTMY